MPGDRLHSMRREYRKFELNESVVPENPMKLLEKWMGDAIEAGIQDPNAMMLATVSATGQPSARIVLLKDILKEGLVFFTNYNSRKGKEIAGNNQAAALFFWEPMERQLRVEGEVTLLDDQQSDQYFATRPEESRISAVASPQSEVVEGREKLKKLWDKVRADSKGKTLNRPPHWGGYVLRPTLFEFWQGRENRLHDRIQFRRLDQAWVLERLAP